jgi:hypothetical protein
MTTTIIHRDDLTITAANLDACEGLPCDLRDEVRDAIESGSEAEVAIAVVGYRELPERVTFAYFASVGRGAMYDGGSSKWIDATSLDDAIAKADDEDAGWEG